MTLELGTDGDRATGDDVAPLVMATRWARLRPVVPHDYPWAFATMRHPLNRWDIRAVAASGLDHDLIQALWSNVHCQFVIAEPLNDLPLGLVSLDATNPGGLTGDIRLLIDPVLVDEPIIDEGVLLFIDYVMRGWAWRRLFVRALEPALVLGVLKRALTAGDETAYEVEARLIDHVAAGDGFLDLEMAALDREAWTSLRHELFRRADERCLRTRE